MGGFLTGWLGRGTPAAPVAPVLPAPVPPMHADWCWRPALWSAPVRPAVLAPATPGDWLGGAAQVFHDGGAETVALAQRAAGAGRPLALEIETRRFGGSFLSLALDLPEEAVAGLTRRYLVGVEIRTAASRPVEIFARLNVRHGPNAETLLRSLPDREGAQTVEFDLAATRLNAARVERAWLDLICDRPGTARIRIRDLTLYRRPRAEV